MPLGFHKAALFGVAGVSTGDVVLLSSQTASGDASIDFTSGIGSTYGEYIFRFYDISGMDETLLHFQVNASGESGFNEYITSTAFFSRHTEADDAAAMGYQGSEDQAQGTGYQALSEEAHEDADASVCGELHLFNPSSTTYVKHFYARTIGMQKSEGAWDAFNAGYINTTTAITGISFKPSGGTFSGKIKMWGVK